MARTLWNELLGAEVRWYDAGGVRTRSIRAGGGPSVLFLHGTGATAEAFARNVIPFSQHFDAHAIDLLGHGMTGTCEGRLSKDAFVRHIVDYLDAAGVERTSIVGNSLGGWLAMWIGLLHPQRVEKIVNVVGPHFAVPVPPGALERARAQTERLRRLSQRLADEPSRAAMRERVGWVFYDAERDLPEELVDVRWALHQAFGNGPQVSAVVGNPGPENLLRPERLAEITQPTLLVWSDHNPGPVAIAESAVSYLREGRLAVMTDCGHWPQWEDAPAFNRIVGDFLLKG